MKVWLVWTGDPIIPVDEGEFYVDRVFSSEDKAKGYIEWKMSELSTKWEKKHVTYYSEVKNIDEVSSDARS